MMILTEKSHLIRMLRVWGLAHLGNSIKKRLQPSHIDFTVAVKEH
jgi:kynureninase